MDTDAGNPRADIAKHHYKSSDLVGNADLYVDWNIWDGLKLNLTGAAHFGGGFDDQYTESSNFRRTPESDSYYKYLGYSEEYTFTSTLSYGNQYMHDRNLPRFGYTDPAPLSDGVLRKTELEDTTIYYLSEEYMASQQLYRTSLGTPDYDYENFPDPRLFVCALQPFVDSVQMTIDGVKAYRKVAQVEFNEWWTMDESTGNDPQTFYGWPVRKYNFLDGHLLEETRNVAGYNIYFIRLPDIYLMYAEILADEGREQEALEYVNKVHRRAYGYDPDSPSPVDYTSLSDRTRTTDPEDHLANNPLLYERWAEMFGEMRWWEDVRRLRIGQQEAEYYKTVSGPCRDNTDFRRASLEKARGSG